MTKVKICGITNIEDAMLAAELGAWAIGFIFYEKSPRYITLESACLIVDALSEKFGNGNVKTIGVFVNESANKVNEVAKLAKLDYAQMHGKETPEVCNSLDISFIKNIRNIEEIKNYKNAFAFLVDASDTVDWGGTGKLADWDFAKQIKENGSKLMLSGGLSIDNIESAIFEVQPDFIDVSSSLEISPGKKNPDLMKEFFENIMNMELKINE